METIDFNLSSLREGDSVGCSITRRGQLHFYWNEDDKGTVWTDLPRDRLLWMVLELCGSAKIEAQSLPRSMGGGSSGELFIINIFRDCYDYGVLWTYDLVTEYD